MKPITKTKLIPSGVIKLAANTPEPFALFICLDGLPYCEVKASRMSDFTDRLAEWKKNNLASLRPPVSVRFFLRTTKDLAIQEART